MASAVYEFKVDTLRDGTYGASVDDLTSRLIGQMAWNAGMTTAYQDFATPARLTVQLDNTDGAFNPDTLGSELVSNGTFGAWSSDDPSFWTVTGESAGDPEVSEVAPDELHGGSGTNACNFYSTGSTLSISKTILTAGTTYRVSFDISASAVDTGYLGIYDNTTLISPRYHLAGSYVFYFNASSTTFKIQTTGAVNITIDNVSVKSTSKYGYLLSEGTLGRLRTTFGGNTLVQYVGRLSDYNITPGSSSRRVCVLQFSDLMYDLLDTEYIPPLSIDVTTDEPMQDLFDNPIVPFPYANAYWMLGVQGASELDLTTTLYEPPSYAFDTGITRFAYVGDSIGQDRQGTSAQDFLRGLMEGEVYGRFFYDPALPGYTFHNRHRDGQNSTVTFTVSELDYEPSASTYVRETVINKCRVTYQPRAVGTPGTIIWYPDDAVGVEQVPFSITARYRDVNNPSVQIGATDVLPMQPGIDYQVYRQPDNTDVTSLVSVVGKMGASSAEITIATKQTFAFVVAPIQIRGTPLTALDPRTVESNNRDSQQKYKVASETVNIRSLSDDFLAQSVADYRANKFAEPVTTFQVFGWNANKTDTRMTNALNLAVGQRITIADSWLGHNADYIVVGFRHTVTMGGDHSHDTAAILKPYFRELAWVLDTSALGLNNPLGL